MLGTDKIKITPSVVSLLCEIDEFKGFWIGLETHTTGLKMLKEVAEFGGDFKKLLGPLKDQTITPAIISVLHAAQLKTSGQSPYRIGDQPLEIFKDGQKIGALDAAPASDVKAFTAKLVEWMNKTIEKRELHPLLTIAIFTAIFLQISPYETDNLKIARFLVIVFMLKCGYSYAPYVPIERVMNDRATDMSHALQALQLSIDAGAPEWNAWLICFLNIMKDQKNSLKNRMLEKNKELSHLPTLSARILKLFEHHNRLQMKQIVKLTNGRRSTIKLRLGEMVDEGYVKRYGNARATWYSLV